MDAYKEVAACKKVQGGFACDEEARCEIFVICVIAKVWIGKCAERTGNNQKSAREEALYTKHRLFTNT